MRLMSEYNAMFGWTYGEKGNMVRKENRKRKILLVDDDMDLSMIVRDMYEHYGYEVTLATNSDEAFQLLETKVFHVIILDINLPGITGFEVCRELRKFSTVPVIFCSARTSENDKLTGLDIGGDDYLAKPYSLKELLSRTNSLMRRTYGFGEGGRTFVLGEGTDNKIMIFEEDRRVTRNDKPVNLALKEYDLLLFLVEHAGEILKKEIILAQVWGAFSQVEMSTLTVHVRWLREKLECDPSDPAYIKTVWGVGYRLEERESNGEC